MSWNKFEVDFGPVSVLLDLFPFSYVSLFSSSSVLMRVADVAVSGGVKEEVEPWKPEKVPADIATKQDDPSVGRGTVLFNWWMTSNGAGIRTGAVTRSVTSKWDCRVVLLILRMTIVHLPCCCEHSHKRKLCRTKDSTETPEIFWVFTSCAWIESLLTHRPVNWALPTMEN